MTPAEKQALAFRLFVEPEGAPYLLLDGARTPDLPGALEDIGARFECLFAGALDPAVAATAPYVVDLGATPAAFDFAASSGLDRTGLLFAVSKLDLYGLRRHLRRLALAELPDGRVTFFRYYDPRALKLVLEVATPEQEAQIFGAAGEVRFLILDEAGRPMRLGPRVAA